MHAVCTCCAPACLHVSQSREKMHRVFFHGHESIPADYFVRVDASSFDELRSILMANFNCLRYGNFAVVEREDGTFVCDDTYFQSLQPNTELLVLVIDCDNVERRKGYLESDASSTMPPPSVEAAVASSNSLVSNLQIVNVQGNVSMSSKENKSRSPSSAYRCKDIGSSTQFHDAHSTPEQATPLLFIPQPNSPPPLNHVCTCSHPQMPAHVHLLPFQYTVSPPHCQIPPSQYYQTSSHQQILPSQYHISPSPSEPRLFQDHHLTRHVPPLLQQH